MDNDPDVVSSALSVGHSMFSMDDKLIGKWSSKIYNMIYSEHSGVQYLSLGLLYKIKRKDPGEVSKLLFDMLSHFGKKGRVATLAHVLLLRMAKENFDKENDPKRREGITKYLRECLTVKDQTVIFEAARSISRVGATELFPFVVAVMDILLTSSAKKVHRFGAMRVLAELAKSQPTMVAANNENIEKLLSDQDKKIASLAVATLLQTGDAKSVSRLLGMVGSMFAGIEQDFRVTVLEASGAFAKKFAEIEPKPFLKFYTLAAKRKSNQKTTLALTKAIMSFAEALDPQKDEKHKSKALLLLCEIIEDCEYPIISSKILTYISEVGAELHVAPKLVNYAYNRTILDDPEVRVAAVLALSRLAFRNKTLGPRVLFLLKKLLKDDSDVVRERSQFYYSLLSMGEEMGGEEKVKELVESKLDFPLESLEFSLEKYLKKGGDTESPFDFRIVEKEIPIELKERNMSSVEKIAQEFEKKVEHMEQIMSIRSVEAFNRLDIPELKSFGKAVKLLEEKILLTDTDAEYTVEALGIVFPKFLVLQCKVTNSVERHLLRNVHISLAPEEEGIFTVKSTKIEELPFSIPKLCYVAIKVEEFREQEINKVEISGNLKFELFEDGEDQGPEEYPLEDFPISKEML